MSPADRYLFLSLAVLATISGCGPDYERQMVFTHPRKAVVQADPKAQARAKARTAAEDAPPAASLPPSNGVDVPAFRPD